MGEPVLVSVIINNYNYGRFLERCIDSALAQTYANREVIVVDDGSTDDSPNIVSSYGERITAVFKENGGQASALNSGFSISRGGVICFLDSDDELGPTAMESVVPLFGDQEVVEVNWPLEVVDQDGVPTGKVVAKAGHAWARRALERVFPIPEGTLYGVDGYLWTILPLFGRVEEFPTPLGTYRWHGDNWYACKPLEERVRIGVEEFDFYYSELARWCARLGRPFDMEACLRESWFHRIHRSLQEMERLISPGESFILVDEDQWGVGGNLLGRRAIPFLERGGRYWGPPPGDETAMAEMERLRRQGASFIVFVWTAFWWLDHYARFHRFLRGHYPCVLENDRLVVFDLRE
ncbi:MAG: glycosyltransferase family 2 protein [Thermodesulfobacteriota bacterium]